ncbi:expressed unknown protein [Seminavis robusta]|uniref:Uncharacterized protein n=1 Tax=Seminavis robusta TaxID=568900 RepID=A0A9N8I0F4_9STRA|nr:expressed unknown protein [Seminavis robusta]|eukprot:Sro3798_g351140.1 n/a (322) ;mRNA; r:1602-2567
MVVTKSGFAVVLVDPATKTPFKEHESKSGEYFVEAEPEAQYFLCPQVLSKPGRDVNEKFIVVFAIDGKKLGYTLPRSSKDGPKECGRFLRENGHGAHEALQFKTARLSTTSAESASAAGMIGTISVSFYTAICVGERTKHDFQGKIPTASSEVLAVDGRLAGKCVRSGQGSYIQANPRTKSGAQKSYSYRKGVHLETIHLKYCTALGLIDAGILPRPPIWEYARLKKRGRDEPVDPDLVNVRLKIEIVDAVVRNGSVISPAKAIDYFDLMLCNDCSEDEAEEDEDHDELHSDDDDDEEEEPLKNNALRIKLPSLNAAKKNP